MITDFVNQKRLDNNKPLDEYEGLQLAVVYHKSERRSTTSYFLDTVRQTCYIRLTRTDFIIQAYLLIL